ncbi:bifunctional tRNA (5-methylaminomethyl-2-thiouridine)(34)-methyltransferase MnmD/FAD-dependent 5-carboxymethylaminomethyl-2-thiouridine(34) oxidoreductase MnmC [Vogesella sp. LIG4]|uniref:bifunctional tRNA (5-methylaminomethyl-2-thiouridine)(34)-methyltransferase MnmD/FAD-dependent 5-carboxymethylaminomethyl-2-thiouridine(34) oxidoreductase MnmC n=1 Tax=Vogesella sp. LIG4 TaxID=1192162 RepID=UPI000820093F|nr:bifunctional tRNA (5-methylaminomethyl-2-thiouridine)(34)-methyltransferase MnmD/FAD-dependent 5-carboxymethylaminomethyl-2-thiouridine(34) oxidoreductase MnmC [Vogesella sp. LIG4]SCK27349.1 tRNA 5-methylaminomethyl-2-thiouridine biosynthesis bifunctional protein [Vogesella sp. LIG4]
MPSPTQPARLDWSSGQPVSSDYNDIYFSRDSGLDETHHVFIHHNQLPQRFAALADGALFSIGETGFGTGLNFLVAWQSFLQHAPAGARLAFVSTEKHPLLPDDLQRALAMWPQLAPQAQQLLQQYAELPPGWHRFVLQDGRISLTLLVGDALDTLPQLDASIDAWFLDGFAPKLNPDMWQPALFAQLARLSAPGATLATFTCAGIVRRGLAEAGFSVEKVAGHGSKRTMTRGQLPQPPAQGWQAPWYARPQPAAGERSALVIGAGIAGASVAHSLAVRGWQVTVLERQPAPASEASGNPQGVLYTKLSPHFTPLTRLLLSGYSHSLRMLAQHLPPGEDSWQQCGVLQLAYDADETKRQQGLAGAGLPDGVLRAVDAGQASTIAGIALQQSALFFAQGGWLHPPALVRQLLSHRNIRLVTGVSISELSREPGSGQWLATAADGSSYRAQVAVLATANDARQFTAASHLPLKPIRGQVSTLPATAASRALRSVICGEGYISPARHDSHCLGATFKFEQPAGATTPGEHEENLAMLAGMAPALYQALGGDSLGAADCGGRAALRCTSPDYLPLAGPLVDSAAFAAQYAMLARDATLQPDTPAPNLPGLYVTTGHGSRGMVTAPLCGEVLASLLENEPLPLPKPLMDALHPSRFLLRGLIRNKKPQPG